MSGKMKLLGCIFCLWSITAFSQETTRGERSTTTPDQIQAPQAEKKTHKKLTRRQYKKTFHYTFYKHHEDLVDDFYKRVKLAKRKYKRQERISKKPRYSDPSYFGHKRKPKKRTPGKMKLCKECSIKH